MVAVCEWLDCLCACCVCLTALHRFPYFHVLTLRACVLSVRLVLYLSSSAAQASVVGARLVAMATPGETGTDDNSESTISRLISIPAHTHTCL
jgi:hypothetical protein